MIVKKGTVVCPSEAGHYNFYYPQIDKEYILSMDIEVVRLNWSVRDGKIPVKVISPEDYLPYKVLWLDVPG